jgi:arginyl-tRNA synthetase
VIEKLKTYVETVCRQLYPDFDGTVELSVPDEQFGDYATNVALRIAKIAGQPPREVAQAIADELRHESIQLVNVAGPGFINMTLTAAALENAMYLPLYRRLEGQVIVAEYSDPNPFKVLHAGHLYTSIIGDAIANLLEASGATVHRVNFGGDVGLHVARTMWAILQELGGEYPEKLKAISPDERSEWMAAAYVRGTSAYEDSEAARTEITTLNKRVYALQRQKDRESAFAQIYWACRQWSYDYFDAFYERIGAGFERYYPESEVADLGVELVEGHIPGVFEESEGAIVFRGEPHGLHTRVFINSEGLPTYEAKDVGLIHRKYQDYRFDASYVITGNEQSEYMAVVLKAVEQFAPQLSHATTHLTHGMVKLEGGVKMASRKGNILRAVDILDTAALASVETSGKNDERVTLAAVKYAFLRNRLGPDVIYKPKESVSLVGNSGPYLQYAHARACSILSKLGGEAAQLHDTELEPAERTMARTLSYFPLIVDEATSGYAPQVVCTYLYELAQQFNRFYEGNRVINDQREDVRAAIIARYREVLKQGLTLLGIEPIERM